MEQAKDNAKDKTVNGVQLGLNLSTMFIDHADTSWESVVSDARISRQPGWWKQS